MTQAGSLAPGLARVRHWEPLLSSPHSRTTIGPTIDHGGRVHNCRTKYGIYWPSQQRDTRVIYAFRP